MTFSIGKWRLSKKLSLKDVSNFQVGKITLAGNNSFVNRHVMFRRRCVSIKWIFV